jgi:AcrR family transcriptional regulator
MSANTDQADGRKRRNPLAAPRRRRPKQRRSIETVEQILEAAIRVMERGGFEGFNMKAVGDEAGLNVATVYSYYANKHQLLAQLARTQMNERLDMLQRAFDRLPASEQWVDAICDSIVELAALRDQQTGSTILRHALHASPELWEIDQEGNRAAAEMIGKLLEKHSDPPCDDSKLRGRLIAEYVTATLDVLDQHTPKERTVILKELAGILRFHLTMR